MKKILLGLTTLGCVHFSMAQVKTYDLYVVAEGNFGTPNGDVFRASRISDTAHTHSGALFQTANNTVGIDVLQDYGTFGNKAVLCSKGAASSPYKLAIVNYPSFDTIKTFQSGGGIQCLGKASNAKAYISMATGNSIQMLDLVNNTLTAVTNTGNQINSYATFMVQTNGYMYVSMSNKIVKIDTLTNTTTTSILPNIGTIAGMQYDATNNCIWLLGKVSGTSALVKLEPGNNDFLNTPITLTGITNGAQLRLAINKLYFLSGKNIYAYSIATPVIPAPLLYTSILAGNAYSFAYGKSFDVDPNTGDFAVATAGNYVQPTQYEIVDGTTFQQIDTGSVTGPIGNALQLHTYVIPNPDSATLADVYAQCSVAVVDTPTALAGNTTIYATTNDSLSYHVQGNHTITWTFLNGYTTVTRTQHIIVDDTIAPVPNTATLPDLNVICPYTATAPTALDNCAGTIPGTTDSLIFTTGGSYSIHWKYNDGNGNITDQFQNITISCSTAINDVQKNNFTFTVYPNPASKAITVDLGSATINNHISIVLTNTLGQVLLQQTANANKSALSLNNIPSGVYYIAVMLDGNRLGTIRKIVVE